MSGRQSQSIWKGRHVPDHTFRLGIGQIPSIRADVEHNLKLIEEAVATAQSQGVNMLVFPELALTGYLVDDRFADVAIMLDSPTMDRLRGLSKDIDIAIGFIEETPTSLFYNSAIYLSRGEIAHLHRKVYLPTYRMFDERRYFGAGWDVSAFDTDCIRSSILICGDAWHLPLPYLAAHSGADLLLILAASSNEGLAATTSSRDAWQWMCSSYALTLSCFVVFANLAEGDDGAYTFWGGSFVAGPDGQFLAQSETSGTDLLICDLDRRLMREQRIRLPFRRDDSLAHTLELGQRVLATKVGRDQFHSMTPQPPMAAPKPR